jgi:hypothetical protein
MTRSVSFSFENTKKSFEFSVLSFELIQNGKAEPGEGLFFVCRLRRFHRLNEVCIKGYTICVHLLVPASWQQQDTTSADSWFFVSSVDAKN